MLVKVINIKYNICKIVHRGEQKMKRINFTKIAKTIGTVHTHTHTHTCSFKSVNNAILAFKNNKLKDNLSKETGLDPPFE